MKKLMMVLPLTILLAYCSGPNNTQTTTDEETIDATTTASTDNSNTNTTDVGVTTTTDEATTDASTNTTTVSSVTTPVADINVTTQHDMSNPFDVNDPMYQHFVRTNGQYWTYDYNTLTGAPLAGTYDVTLNGDWALQMTPELTTAWRTDNSFDLWRSSVGLNTTAATSDVSYNNEQMLFGDTYISASESFDVRDSSSVSEDVSTAATIADVSTINYRAANGNMYLMPRFNLYLDNGSFTGYTGCNNISGKVHVSGTTLHFLNTSPSTAIDCMGGFSEQAFLDMLKKVDSYTYVNNELQLMQGSQVLLKFKRNAQDVSVK
jgi:heat shock protein HslJ